MKPETYITTLLLLIITSCQQKNDNSLLVINTQSNKPSEHYLSEIFDEVGMIKLGTTKPLINYVKKVIKTKEYTFVTDPNPTIGGTRILQFDIEGHFIKQIGSIGHGPGEYFYFRDFTIDTISKRIYIASYNQLMSFDFSGNLMHSSPINVEGVNPFYIIFMTCINEELWSVEQKFMLYKENNDNQIFIAEIIRYNKHLQAIDTTTYLNTLQYERYINLYLGWHCLSNLKEGTYVYCPIPNPEPFLRDTLYQIKDSRLIPALKLDFSEILSVNENITLKNKTQQDLLNAADEIRNITIKNIYRTNRYIFVEYINKHDPLLLCYDLDQQESYNMEEGFTDDLYGTGISEIKPLDLQNGEFYFIKNGYEVEGIIDGINESSNPVIFFIKTKE